jgi:iron complex outermembrane receptor protein
MPVQLLAEEPEQLETQVSEEEQVRPESTPVLPYFVGEVVVSGEEAPPPGTVDTLEAEALAASGAVSVAEALELLPAVSLSTGARNEAKIWVRGYEQSNVLVLLDGVPISDPYYGDLDLGQLPVFDIARITVTRGGASSLYGPNGLGGVINVVTLQGGDSRQFAGQLRLTENRTALAHASAGGGGDRLNWYFGLGFERSDGWELSADFEATPFEDGGTRVNSDFERSSALLRLGWRLDEASSLYASLRWIDAEKGIPFHTTRPAGFVKFARFPEWRQATLALGYERSLRNGGALRGQLFGLGFENTLEVFNDPELESLRLESNFSDRVYGGFLIGEWPVAERHGLGAALHLRKDRHLKTELYPDGSIDPQERYEAWTSSVSFEDRWQVGARTTLIASLAVEHLDVAEARSLRGANGTGELVDDELRNDTLLSPQLELRSDLSARWAASAALYRRSRFPTMRQLYGTDPPNPGLRPQRSTGFDLGVSWELGNTTIQGNVFFDTVDDLISRQGRDEPFRNQDEAELRGLELRVLGSARWLDYRASWTGFDHRFTRSAEGLEEIPWVPRQQLEMLALARLGQRFELSATWLASGTRVYYDFGVKRELERYNTLDLGVAARLGGLELEVRVENVLDEYYEQEDGFPQPGRRIWAGVRFESTP